MVSVECEAEVVGLVGLVEGFAAVASRASESVAGEAAFVLRLRCDKANMITLDWPPAGGREKRRITLLHSEECRDP
jgi:hypothetical protein